MNNIKLFSLISLNIVKFQELQKAISNQQIYLLQRISLFGARNAISAKKWHMAIKPDRLIAGNWVSEQ